MHNLGLIVWLIIVAFGVISSIRKNAQRAQAQRAAPPQRAMPQPPPRPVPAPVPRTPLAMAAFAMPPVDAPQPPPRPVAPPAPKPAPPIPFTPLHVPSIRTSPIRGMFGGSATLVRAIVAAEVLGPPKAFQEQTIWSPRHSEPSI